MTNITYLYNTIYNQLPEMTRELVDLLGWSETRRLARHYGGQRFSVPERPSKTFLRNVSDNTRALLVDHFAHEVLLIPKTNSLMTADRKNSIVHDYEVRFLTTTELSLKYNLSKGRISQILNDYCTKV